MGSSSDGTSLYFKNNVVINLSSTLAGDDYEVDNIGDMEINGNDVYFSGQVLGNVFGSETSDMCFWKNGQLNKI